MRELKVYRVWVRYITENQSRGFQQGTIASESEAGALDIMQRLIEKKRGEKIAFTKARVYLKEVSNG